MPCRPVALFIFKCPKQNNYRQCIYAENTVPLAGVTVTVKETKQSTVTDSSGNFTIAASPGKHFNFLI